MRLLGRIGFIRGVFNHGKHGRAGKRRCGGDNGGVLLGGALGEDFLGFGVVGEVGFYFVVEPVVFEVGTEAVDTF